MRGTPPSTIRVNTSMERGLLMVSAHPCQIPTRIRAATGPLTVFCGSFSQQDLSSFQRYSLGIFGIRRVAEWSYPLGGRTFVKALLSVIFGVAVIAFAYSLSPDIDVVLVDENTGQYETYWRAYWHTPLLLARSGKGILADTEATERVVRWLFRDSQERADFSRVQGTTSLGNPPLRSLRTVEENLVSHLISTDDPDERDQLIRLIRDVRALRMQEETANRGASGRASVPRDPPAGASLFRQQPRVVATSATTPENGAERLRRADTQNQAPAADTPATKSTSKVARFFDKLVDDPVGTIFPVIVGAAYLLIIIAGIYTGSMYENLGAVKSTKKVKLRDLIRQATTAGTWQGIFASPIVFGAVLLLVPKDEISLPMAALAYQNGFFWRATLKRLAEVRDTAREVKAATP